MSKDNENKELAQQYASIKMMIKAVDLASWKWLAITTGVMVYSSFQNSVLSWVSPTLAPWVLACIVVIFYLVIDHGLPESLERFMKGRKSLDQHKEVYNSHKRLLSLILIFFIVRIFATGLSSVWSGGEIGDLTTEDFNTEKYTTAAQHRDSMANAKLSSTESELAALRASEEERISTAEAKGNAEIRAAIKTGNQSQRDMWAKNPGFFDAIPRNKWYKGNKAFADRVHAAQANKQRYIDEERSKTSGAQELFYAVSSDTTSGTYLASLGLAANAELNKLQGQESKRTNMIIISDILALIFGLMCRGIKVSIEKVTGEQINQKSFSYMVAKAMENIRVFILEVFESLLGLDLDGNGKTGQVDNRMTGNVITGFQPSSGAGAEVTTPSPSSRNPIGFIHYTPSPDQKPQHNSVATCSNTRIATPTEEELSNNLQMCLSYFKDAKRNWQSWESNPNVSERAKLKNQAKWQDQMIYAQTKLKALGYEIANEGRKYVLRKLQS